MKLWQIILLTLIFIVPTSYAATNCNLNENCTVYATITESGGFVTLDYVNITIIASDDSILVNNQNMQEIGSSNIFKYTFVPTEKDQLIAYAEFYNSTGKVATVPESIEVLSIKSSGGLPSMLGSAAGLIQMIGLGIIIGLLLYFSFKMEQHPILQLLLFFSCFALLLFIPKVMIDNNDYCSLAPTNTTESGGATIIGYQYVCVPNPNTTSTGIYTLLTKIYYAVVIYVMIFMLIMFGKWLKDWIGGLK